MYNTNKQWIKAESYQTPVNKEVIIFRTFASEHPHQGTFNSNQTVGFMSGRVIHFNLVKDFINKDYKTNNNE